MKRSRTSPLMRWMAAAAALASAFTAGCATVHLGEPAEGGIYDQAQHDPPRPGESQPHAWIHINSDQFR